MRAKLGVEIDDPVTRITVQKQGRFGLTVGIHVAVVIKMVAAQVSKQRRINVHTVDTVLH